MAHVRTIRHSLLIAVLATLVVACGGGGSDSSAGFTPAPTPAPTPTPAPAPVTGVATPDSVSVVTATNAG